MHALSYVKAPQARLEFIMVVLISPYSKTPAGGYEFMKRRQVGCIISIIDSSTIVGFNCGTFEASSDRVNGGLELGTL